MITADDVAALRREIDALREDVAALREQVDTHDWKFKRLYEVLSESDIAFGD